MRTRARFVWLLCATAMVCALAPIAPRSAAAAPLVEVKIAVAAPLSAGATTLGRGLQYGAELAVSEYASLLASAGVTATVLPQDDRGDASTAVAVANEIRANSLVLGVVGHLDSACSVPASKIYNAAGLAMVTPTSAAPILTQQGLGSVFRTCGADTGQGKLAADVAVKNLRLTRAYVVDDSTLYGRVHLANGFASRFAVNGGRVVGRAHVSSKQVSFRALSASIRRAKPNVVYYAGSTKAGAYLLARLRRVGVKCQFMSGDTLLNSAFISTAGAARAEKAIATRAGLPNDQLYGGVAYEARFTSAFPGVASIAGNDAYAYDATVAILKAIIAVAQFNGAAALEGASARDLVRRRVAASDFYGVTGRVRFGTSGDRVNPQYSAWRVRSGAYLETAIIGAPEVTRSYEARRVDVLGTLSPALPTSARTVSLLFCRRTSGGRYVLAKTVSASVADILSSSRCAYQAFNVRLARGSYYVFARQSGNGLATMDGPAKYFTVR